MSLHLPEEYVEAVIGERTLETVEHQESAVEMASITLALGQISTDVAGLRSNLIMRETHEEAGQTHQNYSREQFDTLASVASLEDHRNQRFAPELDIEDGVVRRVA